MVNTATFIIVLALVIALAMVMSWMLRHNMKAQQQLLEDGNKQLQAQLSQEQEKSQMLVSDNAALRELNAATTEKVNALQNRATELNGTIEQLNNELKRLDDIKDALDREKTALATKLENVTRTREQLEDESRQAFKAVASELLDTSRKKMNEEGKTSLDQMLNPLRDQITGLNRELKQYQEKQDVNSQLFNKELEKMVNANKEITQEASRLSSALVSNNKIQGDWGEGVLKRILDLSGLKQDVHYKIQVSRDEEGKTLTNDEGNILRPDFTLFMPDGKNLIIDSKVSLTAFVDYVNATDQQEQQQRLKDHIASVKAQVDLLAKKDYTNNVKNAADFALMFIPNEPAYLAAMQGNQQLWEYAYAKHVVIVSPTHLLSVAQLLMQLWSRDKQSKNAEEIAKEVRKLMDKLDAFASDLDKIQNGINAMQNTFDSAKKKLSGRGGVLSKGNTIRQLAGLKSEEIEQ